MLLQMTVDSEDMALAIVVLQTRALNLAAFDSEYLKAEARSYDEIAKRLNAAYEAAPVVQR